jgi:mannitol-specific phosphotransferase system IIBC component
MRPVNHFWFDSFSLEVTVALNWATIVGSVIAAIIAGLLLRAFDHALKEGYVKRVFLIVQSVYFFGLIAWILAVQLFYVQPRPHAEPVPINMETMLEALGYVAYNGIAPSGHLVMAVGVATGLVLGIWYPDKVRAILRP